MRPALLLRVVIFTAVVAASVAAQTTGTRVPALASPSLAGRDLYAFYCAPCHGADAKGGGPVSEALKTRPSDLTQIARRNGGAFPRARVEAFVTGDAGVRMAAHGTPDMPVWGPLFRALDPSDTMARIRVANIVAYIESMQERLSH